MSEKLLYSMGEVAEMFDVKASLIRYWEREFNILRPQRNKKGNRLFTPADVENLKVIYHLVKERGMTLEGAKKTMKQQRSEGDVPRDAELMERLQHIRSLLVEVREDLKAGADDCVLAEGYKEASEESDEAWRIAVSEQAADETSPPEEQSVVKRPRAKAKPVVKIDEESGDAEKSGAEKQTAVRRPRRKKEDAENKELFAFYEQSLF